MDTDFDLFAELDSFMMAAGTPAAPEVEEDKAQRALARDVEAAPYRAEHYGLAA